MITSFFLAKAIGLYMTIVSLPFIFNFKRLNAVIDEVLKHKGIMLVASLMTLVIGVVLVVLHNVWAMNWSVVITIIAWLLLIRGIIRFYLPEVVENISKQLQNKIAFMIIGIILLLVGLFLIYHGFFGWLK